MNKFYAILVLSVTLISCGGNVKKEIGESKLQKEEVNVNVASDSTEFIHTVFFWMNDSLSVDQIAEFEEGMTQLLDIKTIVKGYYGPPAMTPRTVVDNSYDYAFVVHFNSKEGHDAYQVDSLHINFIAEYKTYWDSIKIYDNLITSKK